MDTANIRTRTKNPYRDDFCNHVIDWPNTSIYESPWLAPVRKVLCGKYAWSIPDDRFAMMVMAFTSAPLIEVGAGNGYWGYFLKQFGIKVACTDMATPKRNQYTFGAWHPVKKMTAVKGVQEHPDHTLLMVWPPCQDLMAAHALAAYPGDRMIYVGEPAVTTYIATDGGRHLGCTGEETFFEALARDWYLVAEAAPEFNYKAVETQHYFYVRRDSMSIDEAEALSRMLEVVNA